VEHIAQAVAYQDWRWLLSNDSVVSGLCTYHVQVRTERGVLPTEDARRTSSVLQRAVEAVEADNSAEAGRILEGVVEDESDQLCQVAPLA